MTGLGIGAMLASLTTIVAEYASDRRRAAAIGFSMAGYPIGAIFGGFATLYLLEAFGWQAVFLFGGLLTGLMIPLSLVFLPESIEYLLTRRDPDTLKRINRVLGKMKKPQLDRLPDIEPVPATVANRVTELLAPAFRRQTALVWAVFFLTLSSLYFAQTWTPQIIVDAGFDLSEGVS
ncbi:MAG: MFS transporter, partial [Gammaproteobacteria bacterium]|nr:MFS transporter [Gammaproteobacteria bacterium]